LIRNLFSFQTLLKTVSAAHQGYEVYVERRFREGFPAFKEAIGQGARAGHDGAREVTAELPAYMHRAQSRLNPIFHFFLDEFGQELLAVFARMDRHSDLDAATQTNLCSADAARVIFAAPHHAALAFLDQITGQILFDVGRMLGMLLSRFPPRRPE